LDKLATGFGDGVEIPYLDRAVETTGGGVDVREGGMGLVCFKFAEIANRRDKEEKRWGERTNWEKFFHAHESSFM